jgi:hypothetical protein
MQAEGDILLSYTGDLGGRVRPVIIEDVSQPARPTSSDDSECLSVKEEQPPAAVRAEIQIERLLGKACCRGYSRIPPHKEAYLDLSEEV